MFAWGGLEALSESEIDQSSFDFTAAILGSVDHDIGWFDIIMGVSNFVEALEGFYKLSPNV